MSCYHPMVGFYHGELNENGKKIFHFANVDFDPATLEHDYPGSVVVPCGRCIGCRLDHSRRWADRMMLEYESQNRKGVFVTLTYECRFIRDLKGNNVCKCVYPDVENTKLCSLHDRCLNLCREKGSLYKKDFQDWMKRLRKELAKTGKQIKFYSCGEYGSWENSHRPHYHAILFGCDLSDFGNCRVAHRNELGEVVYQTDLTDRTWSYGFSSVGNVTWSTCAYVARYVQKKAMDPTADIWLDSICKNKEFSLMSRRPGLGAGYLEQNPDCLQMTSLYVSSEKGSKKINIPKYYISFLPDGDFRDSLLEQRKKFANDSLLNKLQQTDLGTMDYLANSERKKLESIKSLKRSI